jgi:hypothetical protein
MIAAPYEVVFGIHRGHEQLLAPATSLVLSLSRSTFDTRASVALRRDFRLRRSKIQASVAMPHETRVLI